MPIVAKLEILLDDNSRVTLNGPLDNRLLCFGMMEVAKLAIQELSQQTKRSLELSPSEHAEISKLALKM